MATYTEIEDLDSVIMHDEEDDNVDGKSSLKKTKRSTKTTPLQYQMLQKFMQTHPDFTKGKADDNQLLAWDELSAELNKVGTPFHSSIDWRRVWTDFKGSQKRKGLSVITVNDTQCPENVTVEQSNPSSECLQSENIHIMLSAINNKIDGLEVKINKVLEQNTETNRLLKELNDFLKPQSLNDSDAN